MTGVLPARLASAELQVISTMDGLDIEALEGLVEANLVASHIAAVALFQIKETASYKAGHTSFEAYAYERFGISRSTAKRWVALGEELWSTYGPAAKSQVDVGRARTLPTQRGVMKAKKAPVDAPDAGRAQPLEATAEEVPTKHLDIDIPDAAPPRRSPAPERVTSVSDAPPAAPPPPPPPRPLAPDAPTADRRGVLLGVLTDDDPADLRWFFELIIKKGKAHLARQYDDPRPLRALADFVSGAAFQAGVQSGMATAARHNQQRSDAPPADRRDVTPNFKGAKK